MKPENPVSVIPETAPFSTEQRQWLNGFLAGLHSLSLLAPAGSTTNGTPEKEAPAQGTPILILYGSQSGNAEGLAHDLAARIRTRVGKEEFVKVDKNWQGSTAAMERFGY